ncbi:MAG: STAS domain-containing protein [Acidimicrobiales bacterium]
MIEVVTNGDGQPAVLGELDLSTVPALEAWLAQHNGQLTQVDLSGVTFFDSSALNAFLKARHHNANLRIVNPSTFVVKVLAITKMVDYLVGNSEANR